MNFKSIINFVLILAVGAVYQSCSPAGGNNPGHEYMQDMGHSVSYEANVDGYYYYNTWGSHADYMKYAMPRVPVKGTIARGFAGVQNSMGGDHVAEFQGLTVNGSVPYYYGDTEEERTRAGKEIIKNPVAITAVGLTQGKELYDIYCGVCHGATGTGNGVLYDGPNAKYPAAPANLVNDEFTAATNGRFYHAIMYGKNMMGGYSDKLSYQERWNVIHYIRSLQAKVKNVPYTEDENGLPSAGATSGKLIKEELNSTSEKVGTAVKETVKEVSNISKEIKH